LCESLLIGWKADIQFFPAGFLEDAGALSVELGVKSGKTTL